MGNLKKIALAASAALVMTAFVGVSTASATTLEVTGVTKNTSFSITASLKSGTSTVARDTFGFSSKTCTSSHIALAMEIFTGPTVTAAVSTLSFDSCEHPVTVHKPGQFYFEWISGTTNARIYWENGEVTTYSTIHGTYINCKSGAGTQIGTLTGVKHGHAEMDINATLNCSPHLTSKKWTGTYTVTSPTDLGVSP